MVVGLVLEEHQPLLRDLGRPTHIAVVHLHGHHHGAGVDFIRFLHVGELPLLLELAHGHQGQVHQADELAGMPFFRPAREDLLPGVQVAAVCGL